MNEGMSVELIRGDNWVVNWMANCPDFNYFENDSSKNNTPKNTHYLQEISKKHTNSLETFKKPSHNTANPTQS